MSDDHELNRAVSLMLAVGLGTAIGLMLVGGLLAALGGEPLEPRALPVGEIPSGLRDRDPTAFLSAGIVVLLATPAIRVVLLAWEFTKRREWFYAAASGAVVAVLAASLVLGMR